MSKSSAVNELSSAETLPQKLDLSAESDAAEEYKEDLISETVRVVSTAL